MLTPFDDFPIHPSADPIATPATGDPNHYDRYWFNGHQTRRRLLLRRRDGPLPGARRDRRRIQPRARRRRALHLRLGRDAARPLDRHRADPHRGRRADAHHPLRRRAQRARHRMRPDLPGHDRRHRGAAPAHDVARGHPADRPHPPDPVGHLGGHDLRRRRRAAHRPERGAGHARPLVGHAAGRSSRCRRNCVSRMPPGVLAVGAVALRRPLHPPGPPRARRRHAAGSRPRWSSTPSPTARPPWSTAGVRECHDIRYELDWEPGRREIKRARPLVRRPRSRARCSSSSRRCSPSACAASATGTRTGATAPSTATLETGRESIRSTTSIRSTSSSIHLQNLVIATMGDRTRCRRRRADRTSVPTSRAG